MYQNQQILHIYEVIYLGGMTKLENILTLEKHLISTIIYMSYVGVNSEPHS